MFCLQNHNKYNPSQCLSLSLLFSNLAISTLLLFRKPKQAFIKFFYVLAKLGGYSNNLILREGSLYPLDICLMQVNLVRDYQHRNLPGCKIAYYSYIHLRVWI